MTLQGGKGDNPTFWGLLDADSGLTQVPEDPECHCGLAVTVGAQTGEVTNGGLAKFIPQWVQWALLPILWLIPQF